LIDLIGGIHYSVKGSKREDAWWTMKT